MEIAPNLRLPGDARIKITQSLVFYYLLNSEPTMAHYSCSSDGWLAVCGKTHVIQPPLEHKSVWGDAPHQSACSSLHFCAPP